MNFWLSTLSALIAALVAGLVLMFLKRRKKTTAKTGEVDIARSSVVGTKMETHTTETPGQSGDAGNIRIQDSTVDHAEIKTNVSGKQ